MGAGVVAAGAEGVLGGSAGPGVVVVVVVVVVVGRVRVTGHFGSILRGVVGRDRDRLRGRGNRVSSLMHHVTRVSSSGTRSRLGLTCAPRGGRSDGQGVLPPVLTLHLLYQYLMTAVRPVLSLLIMQNPVLQADCMQTGSLMSTLSSATSVWGTWVGLVVQDTPSGTWYKHVASRTG
jgi:hypothetical protein